jgi:hypothetical protein
MTVSITTDDLAKLVDAAVKGAIAGQKAAGGVGGISVQGGGHLDERYFRRMDKFDGVKGSWREFAFQFKVAVGMVNPKARTLLEEIQKAGKGVDFDMVFMDETNEEHITRMGAELYAMLSTLVTGEALTVVRGVVGGDGWMAWSKLSIRYDPRTPAKALVSMLAVMSPKKVKEVRYLAGAIDEWECKVKALGHEHDITVDEKIQVAVLTSLCPSEVQDMIFQWADDRAKYQDIRDKVVALAQNRAGASRPVPMEVDAVNRCSYQGDYEQGWNKESWCDEEWAEEVEVDYVGESCRNCGGVGHYARECPTPKGKGKSAKGEGKSFGKGGYKGGAKGYDGKGGYKGFYKGEGKGRNDNKGKGKGFAGSCWKCGEVGHRAVHCQKNVSGGAGSNMEIGAVTEEVPTTVGGVWAIAAVQAEEWVEVKGKGGEKYKVEDKDLSVVCGNSFLELEVSGREDDSQQINCPPVLVEHEVEREVEQFPTIEKAMNKGKASKRNKFRSMREHGKNEVKQEKKEDVAAICAVPFADCCPPGLQVCTITGEKRWRGISIGEITVDSAAEESVCPRDWCQEFGTKTPTKWLKFVNASGGQMGHYGERTAKFRVLGRETGIMSLNFQVSDVQKPLVAVRRIAEKGNIVQFGPREEDNFIMNKMTGNKICMVRKGGSYVIPAEMIVEVEGFTRQAPH